MDRQVDRLVDRLMDRQVYQMYKLREIIDELRLILKRWTRLTYREITDELRLIKKMILVEEIAHQGFLRETELHNLIRII